MQDPYSLDRFINAQEENFEQALAEIKNGQKESHWIWYIFPQLRGLGHSGMTHFYGINDLEEAKEYLKNDILRANLIKISQALYECNGEIRSIMGYPDDLKVLSCMTLFNVADPSIEIFKKVLDKFYDGDCDKMTLDSIDYSNSPT